MAATEHSSERGRATIGPASETLERWRFVPKTGALQIAGSTVATVLGVAWEIDRRDIVFEIDVDDLAVYDVMARPEDGSPETARLLVRELMDEALGSRARFEARELPAVVLRRRAGAAALEPSAAAERSVDTTWGRFRANRAAMTELVHYLRSRSARPVIDETGLGGEYDFALEWDTSGGENALLLAFYDLGLELVDGTSERRVLVVRDAAAEGVE